MKRDERSKTEKSNQGQNLTIQCLFHFKKMKSIRMLLISCNIKSHQTVSHRQLVKSTDIFSLDVQRRKNLLSTVLTVNHVFTAFRYRKVRFRCNHDAYIGKMVDNKAVGPDVSRLLLFFVFFKRTSCYQRYLIKGVITQSQEAKA